MDNRDPFRFEYDPGTITYGRDCVADLGAELGRQGLDRALVVCGRTVGSTPDVIDPVREGLGDRLVGVFDQTTPAKRLSTAFEGTGRMRESDADALVALGGGSSLDVAKVMSVAAASDREAIAAEFAETGTIPIPENDPTPVVAVPTTLAGADLSILAGVTAAPDSRLVDAPVGGGIADRRLMPAALFYDPALFATTPRSILAASAMNGFDKGIETLYARTTTPMTDATASRGLELLAEGLPTLAAEDPGDWDLPAILQGIVLVQYGISRPDGTTLSLIHAFGHGLTAHSEIHAASLGVPTAGRSDDWIAERVVGTVADLRDDLDLPARLRDVPDVDRSTLASIAETTAADSLLANVPEGFEASEEQLRDVLDAAW
ncbi:alcohol dehydrogenase [Halobacteriales archaeon QH_2_66_30]|nr:MAG: alcohol dehydrogenase [Halobacteriales archaeon QH_2_66_30]